MTDPWMVRECRNSGENNLEPTIDSSHLEENTKFEFEDDFSPQLVDASLELPDSKQYLESLERKLFRLKRDPNILQQLSEKREECIRNLLNESLNIDRDGDLALDAPVALGDSTVHEIYRHIRPIQPINIGETVHIVKHDQLEEQRVIDEGSEDSVMDSQFGEVFLFLTNLAWKCRITLPVLVTAVFMAMDIRLQIEINIQTGPVGVDVGELDDYSEDDDEWDSTDSDESDTED